MISCRRLFFFSKELKNNSKVHKEPPDHRALGVKQQLFNFTKYSPGSAMFYPHGTLIYNKLVDLMKSEYKIRGYHEVITPNLYNSQLWKVSGHYFKYKQNIYFINQHQEQNGLKPMNCPGHCIMFDSIQRSYRDLPIRFADFGVLHRNEVHGSLSGLTRVRRFQQDDAHIFCTTEQIKSQILEVLDLLDYVYSLFGFKYTIQLSTRPQKYLGKLEQWNIAEQQLKQALEIFGSQYKINAGDGAFYGPKIDVKLFDSTGRQHQCGTIQLDFQLPIRFDLQYRSSEPRQRVQSVQINQQINNKINTEQITKQQKYGEEKQLKIGFNRPVIIHRAIFGSLERFIAILCEHTAGKWDFWISPRQFKLLPLSQNELQYAQKIRNTLILRGYNVEIDEKKDSLSKMIRNAQIQGFNYIGIIGKQQVNTKTISLRKSSEKGEMSKYSIERIIQQFQSKKPPKSKKRIAIQQNSL